MIRNRGNGKRRGNIWPKKEEGIGECRIKAGMVTDMGNIWGNRGVCIDEPYPHDG
jgi:hypothetical protein